MTADDRLNIEEYDIRMWFMQTDLTQAMDTFRVVGGIIEARVYAAEQPKRKKRSDAGKPRPGTAGAEGLFDK